MRAGKLRHRVTIQQYVIGSPQQKPSGEPDGAWTALYTDIAAEWVTLSGRALFAAQEHHAEVRGTWRIRWRDGITAQMRVVHDGLYYNILWVPPYDKSGKRWQMDLECAEGVNEGRDG